MTWFVDAHTHYQRCFGWRPFLTAALANLDRWAASAAQPQGVAGCLCFVDVAGEPGLASLVETVAREPEGFSSVLPAGSRIVATRESTAWRLERNAAPALLLVAGRQVATREGLEVLALSNEAELRDGLSLSESVAASLESAAVTVLPWGFGKWWLGRGRTVQDVLAEPRKGRVYLGDNGNRAAWSSTPDLFVTARREKLPILPGSDPLPFPHHAQRALGYGFRLEGALDVDTPGASLRQALGSLDHDPDVFGQRSGMVTFVADQVRMQWKVAQRRSQRARSSKRNG